MPGVPPARRWSPLEPRACATTSDAASCVRVSAVSYSLPAPRPHMLLRRPRRTSVWPRPRRSRRTCALSRRRSASCSSWGGSPAGSARGSERDGWECVRVHLHWRGRVAAWRGAASHTPQTLRHPSGSWNTLPHPAAAFRFACRRKPQAMCWARVGDAAGGGPRMSAPSAPRRRARCGYSAPHQLHSALIL